MKKKIWISIAVIAVIVLATVLVASCGSVGRFLRTDNGTPMIVCYNSPIYMSTRTERDIFKRLETGDKIWVLHDAVAESYPGRTRAYAVIRLGKGSVADIPQGVLDSLRELGRLAGERDSEPPQEDLTVTETTVSAAQTTEPTTADSTALPAQTVTEAIPAKTEPPVTSTAAVTAAPPVQALPENLLDPQQYEVTVCYSNYCDARTVFQKSVNAMHGTGAYNLPVFVFDSTAELAQFEQDFSEFFSFQQGYNEMPSFHAVKGAYDEAFFENNAMILVYLETGSGSYRYGIRDILFDDSSMLLRAEQLNRPLLATADMAGWFLMVSLPRTLISGITSFDAEFTRTE